MGLCCRQEYASTAWHSASMPVAAVMRGGSVRVMRGSSTAASGSRLPEMNSIFSARASSRTTATAVASEPVPAVVGTAMNGTCAPRGMASQPISSLRSRAPCAITMHTPLAVSSTEPPPTATTLSHPLSRYVPAIRLISEMDESGGTSVHTACAGVSPSRSARSHSAIRPVRTSPASLISRGRCAPSSRNSCGMCSSASAPASSRGGV